MIIDRKTVSDDVFDKLEAVMKCTGKDTSRPMLSFVKLHVEKEKKYIVSTDGRCMAVFDVTHVRIPEILTAKRCRIYRFLDAGRGTIIVEDCTATCGVTFPNWQRVDPDLSQYEQIVTLDDKTHSTRYTKLVYALSAEKKMPITIELFDVLKRMGSAKAQVLAHMSESQKAIVIMWGSDFRLVAMPITVDLPVKTICREQVA